MNSKKAKRLRQLVKHLQNKGVVESGDWAVYGLQQHKVATDSNIKSQVSSDPAEIEKAQQEPQWVVQQTRMLDPACGKAIYKKMKARAL